jgi:hypothetical protein
MPATAEKPIVVDASIAPKLREWFSAGRGVRVWCNADLSSGNVGHQMFTPADNRTAPSWRYVDAGAILPADIAVETFTPRTSFNGCAKCRYWGMDVSDATRAKARRLTRPGETWNYTIERDYGRTFARVSIGTMVSAPF